MQEIDFSPSDPLTTISLSGDIGDTTNEVKYTSNQQHANWDWGQQVGNNPQTSDSGTTNLEFTSTAKGSWKDLSDDNHPNRLGLEWTKDTTWKINTAAHPRAWWQWFCDGNPNSVPEHFKNLQVPGPDVDLTMDSLDYFLTTNLLYPGKHVFQADTPSSDSTAKELALPRDSILTGTIKAT